MQAHSLMCKLNARQGLPEGGLRRVILTASGGAFRDWDVERLASVTVLLCAFAQRSLSLGVSLLPTPAQGERSEMMHIMREWLVCAQ